MSRVGVALVAAALTALLLAPLGAAAPSGRDGRAALDGALWLANQPPAAMAGGQQADAIVALSAAGRSRIVLRARLARLEAVAPRYAATPGRAAKVVLAGVAAGRNPRSLGGVDYLSRVQGRYARGFYSRQTFEQALSMIAVRAAGGRVPEGAVVRLKRARGAGGWGLAMNGRGRGSRDSIDVTALVIEAMRAAGVPARDPALRGATRWMLAQRHRGGGYASAGGGRAPDANSTAAAIRALRALGTTPPARTRAALRRLQDRDGGFRFTASQEGSRLLATNDAVVALSGTTLLGAARRR